MSVITASDIIAVILTGGSYNTGFHASESVDFSDVELEITNMDGAEGACDDMFYGPLKDHAASLVAEKKGPAIANFNGWVFVNDLVELAA
jgi:hypothetical protein